MKTIKFLMVLVMFLSIGTAQANIVIDGVNNFVNITSGALTIASFVDGYSCSVSYCIYQPWYASGQIYAKNGSTQKIDFSGTTATTVINSALSNLPVGRTWKETVKLKGNFTITTNLLPKNYTIIDASESKLTLASGSGDDVYDAIIDIAPEIHDVDIIGGIFEGNSIGQTSWHILIRMMGGNSTLSKAKLNDSKGDCIFSRAPYNKVFENIISNCQDTGIVMGGLKTSTSSMYGKGYKNILINNSVALDISNDADYVTYEDNTIINTTNNGISITYTANGIRMPWHAKILNNNIINAGTNISGKSGINVVYAGAEDILIEGNTLNNSARIGIISLSQVKLINNYVKNSFHHGISLDTGSNGSLIDGNEVLNSGMGLANAYSGIAITAWKVTISNNKVYDNQSSKTQYRGIQEVTGSNQNRIVDNDMGDTSGGAKILTLGTNTVQRDNYNVAGYAYGSLANAPTAFGGGDTYYNSTKKYMCLYTTSWVFLGNSSGVC
jgi:hypothetical protein